MTTPQLLSFIFLLVMLTVGVIRYGYISKRREYMKEAMNLAWLNAQDNGLDIENELFWLLVPSYKSIVAIDNIDVRDALMNKENAILVCTSFRSEIQKWYI